MAFNNIGIIGPGLIGGSLARAFAASGLCVYALDSSADTLAEAAGSQIFEGLTDDMETFLSFPLDLIYICVPVKTAVRVIEELKGCSVPVTDASSTKGTVINAARDAGLNFCGGHPIAGSEKSGFKHSDAELFSGAYHIVTPVSEDFDIAALEEIHRNIGMKTKRMDADKHDLIFGAISHLPHITAFSLVETVRGAESTALEYTGGGFRDFTRIAASDARMWTDIFLDNQDNMIELIDSYIESLIRWREEIRQGDEESIFKRIEEAAAIRRGLQ
ncbi:prephenate dehydrogenase [Limisalsivibrio acetivorans]|uniref:prephenate dehydrogenase n=1 Tax=Limisalsivibrio acetivorans TaxID=1304888 RepID=UPI0003B72B13|nr:prephenate dehydrogenase/arogenate dehydrogenase family protein [Limisalsivibrio acetivorans]